MDLRSIAFPWAADDARRYCEQLAVTLEVDRIVRKDRPYLDRYFVQGWRPGGKSHPGPSIFLHHFLSSDEPGVYHSHPWAWSCSVILVGGYREFRCTRAPDVVAERTFSPGETNVIFYDDRHRIELLGADCWTIFFAGSYARPWTFGQCS